MIYIRIVGCAFVSLFGLLLTYRQLFSAFSNENIVKVDGLLNMWGSYGMLLAFFYFTLYHTKNSMLPKLPIGKPQIVTLVIALVASPLLAMGNYGLAKANVASYVECKNERKLSSRYSSRTYAISQEVCESLEVN